jgi:hypothetical protein
LLFAALGGDFTETLIDGRTQASAVSRAFDFASVGADFVTEVDVLRTPYFNLSSGAVGATVNIKFPKPFDHPGLRALASASETETTNDGSFRPTFGVLFSNTFFDDGVGILFDGDYSDQHIDSHHYDVSGWNVTRLHPCQFQGGQQCVNSLGEVIPNSMLYPGNPLTTPAGPYAPGPAWSPQSFAIYNDRTDERRKDARAVIQWNPSDTVMLTLDDNHSDDRILSYRNEYSTWFDGPGFYDVTRDANGTITSFQYGPAPTDFDADFDGSYVKNNTFGLNVKWDVSDHWTVQLDAAEIDAPFRPGRRILRKFCFEPKTSELEVDLLQ